MSKDLLRSLAKAIGGRVKSFLVQAAKDEAARAVRHFRARMQEPQRSGEPAPPDPSSQPLASRRSGEPAPADPSPPSLEPRRSAESAPASPAPRPDTPAASPIGGPASRARPSRTPERAATKQARTGDAVKSAGERASPARSDPPADAVLDVNTASKDELIALPGIGEARADAIIRGRPFAAPGDLVERKILPAGVFDKLKHRIGTA